MKNIKCRNCFFYRNEWCEKIVDSPDPEEARDCNYFREMTNADRIRAMTDEELAEFIPNWNFDACRWCDHYTACKDMVANNECEKCVLEWLQQPSREEDKHEPN